MNEAETRAEHIDPTLGIKGIKGEQRPLCKVDIMQKQLTAFIEREGSGYVSICPELDIASQGDTIEEARENLREALELFFETASPEEIQTRLHEEY